MHSGGDCIVAPSGIRGPGWVLLSTGMHDAVMPLKMLRLQLGQRGQRRYRVLTTYQVTQHIWLLAVL